MLLRKVCVSFAVLLFSGVSVAGTITAISGGKSTSPSSNVPDALEPASVWLDPQGGLVFKTSNDLFTSRLSGYIQIAPIYFSGNTADTVNNIQNLNSGVTIPEARIEWSGSIYHEWQYEFSYDFVDKVIKYADVSYVGVKGLKVMGGQFKPVYSSIGNIESRTYRIFLENSLPVEAFIPTYLMGVQARYDISQWQVAAGIVVPPMQSSENGLALGTSSDPVGMTSRVGFDYRRSANHVLFTSVGNYLTQSVNRNVAEFRSLPEAAGRYNAYLVDTGVISGVSGYDIPAIEFADVEGPFFADGGYYLADVYQKAGPNLVFDGYTMELGYFFTGEYRQFSSANGEFGPISPVRHSDGAWQMGLRYSYLDLTSHNIAGGKEADESVVLNWYPRNRIRMGVEYIYAAATPSDNGLNRRANIMMAIGQVNL